MYATQEQAIVSAFMSARIRQAYQKAKDENRLSDWGRPRFISDRKKLDGRRLLRKWDREGLPVVRQAKRLGVTRQAIYQMRKQIREAADLLKWEWYRELLFWSRYNLPDWKERRRSYRVIKAELGMLGRRFTYERQVEIEIAIGWRQLAEPSAFVDGRLRLAE